MSINIKNQYLFNLFIYVVSKSNEITEFALKSGKHIKIPLQTDVDKLIFSYKKISFLDISQMFINGRCLDTGKCLSRKERNKLKSRHIDKTINKNMDLILEIFELSQNKILNRFINKINIKNIYDNECIMCLEIKPTSKNYFQCVTCKNKFLCSNCFNKLQTNDNLSSKCLLCYQDFI